MTFADDIEFYEGEDESLLKNKFVELSARHHASNYSAFEICQYVFQNLRDPFVRANKAAMLWSKDLDLKERIRKAILEGPTSEDTSKERLKNVAMQIALDHNTAARDRVAALKLVAEMNGDITKPIDLKVNDKRDKPPTLFKFVIDEDADKPPEPSDYA